MRHVGDRVERVRANCTILLGIKMSDNNSIKSKYIDIVALGGHQLAMQHTAPTKKRCNRRSIVLRGGGMRRTHIEGFHSILLWDA
jgi:hypothetical protein